MAALAADAGVLGALAVVVALEAVIVTKDQPLQDGVQDWVCECGWTYHHPTPLFYPPTHRCKPTIRRTRVLTPHQETP